MVLPPSQSPSSRPITREDLKVGLSFVIDSQAQDLEREGLSRWEETYNAQLTNSR